MQECRCLVYYEEASVTEEEETKALMTGPTPLNTETI